MDIEKNTTYLGYIRVSKSDMCLDRQMDALIVAGVPERNIYQEKVTGTKRDRDALNQMIESIKPNENIVVVVAELSRLSRSTKDLFEIVELIQSKGADIKSLKEPWLDTTSAQGKLLYTIFAGLSQFERDLLSDRTKDGLKAAKARGRMGGRPSKRTDKTVTVNALYSSGVKIAEIVRQTALSRSTVNRIIRDIRGGRIQVKLCLQCKTTRYTKNPCKCPICENTMIQVDGRLRKVAESLHQSDLRIAFATCETYTNTGMCTAEIIIGFALDYDNFLFENLPEHFVFISDKYGPTNYTLDYVLNHIGGKISMIIFNYCDHPSRCEPAPEVLKGAIAELYDWANGIRGTGKWAVAKLGGYL